MLSSFHKSWIFVSERKQRILYAEIRMSSTCSQHGLTRWCLTYKWAFDDSFSSTWEQSKVQCKHCVLRKNWSLLLRYVYMSTESFRSFELQFFGNLSRSPAQQMVLKYHECCETRALYHPWSALQSAVKCLGGGKMPSANGQGELQKKWFPLFWQKLIANIS